MGTARQWTAWSTRKAAQRRIAHSLKLLDDLRKSPPVYKVLPVKGGMYGILKRDAFTKQGTWLPQEFPDSERANEFLANYIRQQVEGPKPESCSYCEAHKGDNMMPPHTPSSACESGKKPHCTCDACY